jgi:rubrerythrin
MIDRIETQRPPTDGYVSFWASGETAKGEFHCSDCGYGVTVHRALPLCPMCGGSAWEQVAWSPFTRALAREQRSEL